MIALVPTTMKDRGEQKWGCTNLDATTVVLETVLETALDLDPTHDTVLVLDLEIDML